MENKIEENYIENKEKSTKKFGGQQSLEQTQYRDQLKNKYCQENSIKLIRIPYTKTLDEIEDIIVNIHKP